MVADIIVDFCTNWRNSAYFVCENCSTIAKHVRCYAIRAWHVAEGNTSDRLAKMDAQLGSSHVSNVARWICLGCATAPFRPINTMTVSCRSQKYEIDKILADAAY